MKKTDKVTILLVDDKPANIFALQELLQKQDRLLLSANNGNDALKIALNRDIDLIILDVQMPGMDGFEVAQILKSSKKTKDIPIIFASAEKKEHKSIMKGFEEGAVDYLFKPLDPEVTKAKVAVLTRIQLQKKELIEKNSLLEKSALLINNSADIISIIDAKSLKFEEVNNAFTSILGYPREEIRGISLPFLLDNEDRTLVMNMSRHKNEKLSFETRIYSKKRTIKWLHWHVVVKNGKWYANARDITEVKQVERIRNYITAVVKQSNDAIYIHDHEGKIISWNEGAEKIYGYTESEALKMKVWNIIPEYLQPETQETLSKIMDGGKVNSYETKRITKHGKLVDVLFSASAITDSDNDQVSIAITERDVTQQKNADEQIRLLNADLQKNVVQLETTNKELESFSYSVSHDLRAPLRALNGYAKMMEEDHSEKMDSEAIRLLNNIAHNALKMGQLIDDLLKFSKLGRKEIQKSAINMNELVQNSINEIASSTLHNAGIKVKTLLPAYADYTLLNQVWINLIANAIKYSTKKADPQIEIGSDKEENRIIYYVKDNGAGFDMAYANKLFGVFQRLHSSEEFEGTGIGLAIIQRIITKHGGKAWAEGEIDKGATFYFTLPVIQ